MQTTLSENMEDDMERVSLAKELSSTTYPGRGIVIGRTKDGKKAEQHTLSWAEAKTAATEYL